MTKKDLTPAQQYHGALHEMPSAIAFNAKVSYGKTNFKYVDFKALRDAVLPILAAYSLSVRYTTLYIDGVIFLRGSIYHKDGVEVNSFDLPLRTSTKPQDLGSELTYFKRYILAALTNTVSDEDDDGNFADKAEAARKEALPKKPKGSHNMDKNMRPFISAILASTSMEEFEQIKVDYKEPLAVIMKEWPDYMKSTPGEQTKSFTDQIKEHKLRLQDQEKLEKQQRDDSSNKAFE